MVGPLKPRVTSRTREGRVIASRDLLDEYLEKDLSRRKLLLGALASAAAVMGCGSGDPAGAPSDAGTDRGPLPADVAVPDVAPTDTTPPRTTHLVGLGQSEDHAEAADLALAETAGFDFVQPGQRVYLKVNTNSGDAYPYSTSPEMIRWVVGKVRERGGECFVGDRSFFGDRNTARNFNANGIKAVCDELGIALHVFGDPMLDSAANAVDWMDLPTTIDGAARSAVWSGPMRIPTMVAQADHIVAMPCAKTHFIAGYTMSMKNLIGLINPVDRSAAANLGNHSVAGDRLFRQVAFMNKAGPAVSLVVLDAHRALISGGPLPSNAPARAPAGWVAQTADPHVVIVSRDRVAADLTGLALLKTLAPMYEAIQTTTARANRQMARALESAVGMTSTDAYDLSGPSVANLERTRGLATA